MISVYQKAQVSFSPESDIGQEGRNSKVFKAHDEFLDANIAIKQITKSSFSDQKLYFDEARILYSGAHSNVVPIHYACEDDEYIYLAMPYFKNGSLKSRVKRSPLTLRELVILTTQFLSGLHHIHSKGLIHFDIKPDNILISDRGEALLSDFGLAKRMDANGCAIQGRTYVSMAPPEFDADTRTKQSDIYQVGLTLYRLVAGDDTFIEQFNRYWSMVGDEEQFDRGRFRRDIEKGVFPDFSLFPEHIPTKIKKIIKTCIRTSPDDRYRSAFEVINELADIDDNLLDWKYFADDGERKWVKTLQDREHTITVFANGSSKACKTINGNKRKVTAFCLDKITSGKVIEFLKTD